MNAYFCDDLKDCYNYSYNNDDEYKWIQEKLQWAAKNKFDHVIVMGLLSKLVKSYCIYQKITVEEHDNKTIFSGWANIKENGKTIVSHFSQQYIDEQNIIYEKSRVAQALEDEEFARMGVFSK